MESLIETIQSLARSGNILVSDHGYDELANDDISANAVVAGLERAVVIKEYREYRKGPCILVLERDGADTPIHAVWGIPRGETEPAVLITAYRPNPAIWESDFLRRRR